MGAGSKAIAVTVAVGMGLLSPPPAEASGGLRTVALTDDEGPGSIGAFVGFGVPSLNNSGHTAFAAFLDTTSGPVSTIWSEGGGGGLRELVVEDFSADLDPFFPVIISDSGHTAFSTGDGNFATRAYIAAPNNQPILAAASPQDPLVTPSTNARLPQFQLHAFSDGGEAVISGFTADHSPLIVSEGGVELLAERETALYLVCRGSKPRLSRARCR